MVIFRRADHPGPSSDNRLLGSLSETERARLERHLTRVPLTVKQVVGRQGQPIECLYFPDSGVISLLSVTEEGKSVGIGVIGKEGVVGVHAMYPGTVMPCEASVQIAGAAWLLTAADLRHEIRARGELAEILGRYSQALLMETMQTCACSRLHSIRQRVARSILAIHQRAGQTRFRLTQDLLALTLGVRRPTVSIVARDLQGAGLIDYRYGRMTILDLHGLEAASCECPRVAQEHVARLPPLRRDRRLTSSFGGWPALA